MKYDKAEYNSQNCARFVNRNDAVDVAYRLRLKIA